MSEKKATKKTGGKAGAKSGGFSAEERAAMKERARELKAEAEKADGEGLALAAIAAMAAPDRVMGERLHALVEANAPGLSAKTWYGMPAYARRGKDGKVVCFFQSAHKFKARYATFGFTDEAKLDDGAMWPTSFALKEWTGEVEARIVELLKKAAG